MPGPAEQSDTASDGKTPSEKQSDPPEQVSTSPSPAEQSYTATTLETSNSLSKAQTSNSTAPLELVQPSLEQLQANGVSPIQADNAQDDPLNYSQEEGQGDEEELKEDSDDGKITCMCISALDTLTFLLQVHIHVHVHVHVP